jgi:hypothetical protein
VRLQGRGKNGGGRVIYWFYSSDYPVLLLTLFAKNEAEDLTPAQYKQLADYAARMLSDLGEAR